MKKIEKSELIKATLENLVNEMTASFETSLLGLLKKFKVVGDVGAYTKLKSSQYKLDKSKSSKVKERPVPEVKQKKLPGHELFLDVLRNIGRPAMTREIAGRFKMVHPDVKIPKDKKVFMQQLYNDASYLSKEGLIVRTPVGKRMYEYSIKPESPKKHSNGNHLNGKVAEERE